MKILIADDDAVSRRLLSGVLERQGHEVVAVEDGPAASAALLRAGAPTLAILDWEMPGANGLDVCREVRQHAASYIYVIILTAKQRREDMMAALDAGVDDFLTKPLDAMELRARLRSGQRVLELQERLLQAQERLREQATHDQLTGLWNRRMAFDQLALELRRAARDGQPLSIAMGDLDGFKMVNDTHGHLAGDTLLREVARRLRSIVRVHDGAARYGGDEFLLILAGCNETDAVDTAERARLAIGSEAVLVERISLPITISFGLATTTAADIDPQTLIHMADTALYRAKHAGRNQTAVSSRLPADSR